MIWGGLRASVERPKRRKYSVEIGIGEGRENRRSGENSDC
jgi:hypothetical protein